jgi:hypothetical protein
MQIPKDKILDMLRESGDDQKASQADRELPDPVDTSATKAPSRSSAWTPRSCSRSSAAQGSPGSRSEALGQTPRSTGKSERRSDRTRALRRARNL